MFVSRSDMGRRPFFDCAGTMFVMISRPLRRKERSARLQLASTVFAFATVVVACCGSSASAAGDTSLSKYLLTNPGRIWVSTPQNVLNQQISTLTSVEESAAKATGMTALVAGNAWRTKNHQLLEIFLVAFIGKPLSPQLRQSLKVATRSDVDNLCDGSSTGLPSSVKRIASPPGYLSFCPKVDGKLKGAAFLRGNVLVTVASTDSTTHLLKTAKSQYKNVPSRGVTETTGVETPE
jgi:hypothetical protein